MRLENLQYSKGSKKKKVRVGRGTSSGCGKTSSRGQKGQNSRSGGGTRPGFEGGQTPLYRRLPKFGFKNISTKKYTIINLDQLNKLGLKEVNHKTLIDKKIIKNNKTLVKILGDGKITNPITVSVNKVSKSASEKIIKAGGEVKEF